MANLGRVLRTTFGLLPLRRTGRGEIDSGRNNFWGKIALEPLEGRLAGHRGNRRNRRGKLDVDGRWAYFGLN